MVDETQTQQGSLEKRGIAVETVIDENVLSPSTAKSVRFRTSKPSGYAYGEVDDFVRNIVQPSIDWYAQTLYQRDKVVHFLGSELDKAETDITNLKSQIQFLEYNSRIEQGISQNADDKEMAALMARLEVSEAEAASLRQQLENQQSFIPVENDSEKDAYIEQLVAQYNELTERYTQDTSALQAQLQAATEATSATASNTDQEAYIEQVTTQYNDLMTRYNEDVASLQAQLDTALANQSNGATSSPEQDAYIEQITNQYNELMTRYTEDTQALETQLQAALLTQSTSAAEANGSGLDEETSLYIEQITNQYNELMTRYTEDVTALQSQLQDALSNSGPVTNDSDEVLQAENTALKDELARTQAYVAQLDEYITLLEKRAGEQPNTSGAPVSTPAVPEPIVDPTYGQLPPGIRPDDLV